MAMGCSKTFARVESLNVHIVLLLPCRAVQKLFSRGKDYYPSLGRALTVNKYIPLAKAKVTIRSPYPEQENLACVT
jgi:hypothetical protein